MTLPLWAMWCEYEKIYTVSEDISLTWVKERVIPSGRQNIGSILKNYKLKEYSEMALLSLSKGRCFQDNCYIEDIPETDIPENKRDRMRKNPSLSSNAFIFYKRIKFLLFTNTMERNGK